MSIDKIISEFKENGFIELPISLSQEYFKEAMESFIDVLDIDKEIKDEITKDYDPTTSFGMTGFIRKDGKKVVDSSGYEKTEDYKEYFQYNYVFRDRIPKEILNSDPRLQKFIPYAEKIYTEGLKVLKENVQILDEKYPGLYDSYFPEDEDNSFIKLRFLAYYSEDKEEFLAKPHFDRGAITIAFAESADGLRLAKKGKLEEVSHKNNNAFLFPGAYFNKYIDSSIEPTLHDVIQKPENKVNNKIARLAVVLFSAPARPMEITLRDSREKAEKLSGIR